MELSTVPRPLSAEIGGEIELAPDEAVIIRRKPSTAS
jgi:hypothetical protein